MNYQITKKKLKDLINQSAEDLISLYMKTDPKGNVKKSKTRCKDLIGKAKIILTESGKSPKKVQSLLSPIDNFLSDDENWKKLTKGLALFSGNNSPEVFKLDSDLPNLIMISNKFHLKPLIKYKNHDRPYWILKLDRSQPKLFRATKQYIREISPEDMPDDLKEFLERKNTDESSVQFHTKTRHQADGRPAVFHGHGEPDNFEENALSKFVYELESAVTSFINYGNDPLILVGEDSLVAKYRKINSYEHLHENSINKIFNEKIKEKLHKSTRDIMTAQWKENQTNALENLNQVIDSELITSDVGEIVNASIIGSVDSLFLSKETNIWGTYNPDTSSVKIHKKQRLDNIDLASLAAEQCYMKDRNIYFVDKSMLPDNANMTAILHK